MSSRSTKNKQNSQQNAHQKILATNNEFDKLNDFMALTMNTDENGESDQSKETTKTV